MNCYPFKRSCKRQSIFITHDINEAFKLGTTVAIMRDGKIVQLDTPQNMFINPADEYVSKFIDSADRGKVFTAKHVMVTPSCMVRPKDAPAQAIREMRSNEVSTAYAVDERMGFSGNYYNR